MVTIFGCVIYMDNLTPTRKITPSSSLPHSRVENSHDATRRTLFAQFDFRFVRLALWDIFHDAISARTMKEIRVLSEETTPFD
jgi:hypothetical protein